MAKNITQLVNDEIYHVVFRAVGDTEIFNNEDDFYRAIFSLYEFNNTDLVEIWLRRKQRKQEKLLGSPTPQRDLLVEVMLFSLMPNHVHLLLKQKKDGGISRFIQKVSGGYANYFNRKYKRKGHLFNKFRSVHIKDDKQLYNVFLYVHANPISLVEPGWKENSIKNPKRVIKFLENYKWSSYLDYIGKNNFPSIIEKDFLLSMMGDEKGCRDALNDWVAYKGGLKTIEDIILE